jgi:ribosome-associated protein
MAPTKPPTKTTKASKKSSKKPAAKPSKAPAKKAPAPKKVAKAPASKKAAKTTAKVAKKAPAKPASKPASKPTTKPAAKTKAATKPVAKAAAKKPALKASKPTAKPVTKPVKVGIAEGTAPLVPLTRADSQESRPPKRTASALRYVNDAESDQTRGSIDELESLDVINRDNESPDADGDADNTESDAPVARTRSKATNADRDAFAAGPEGDEPLLTTEERAARKIEHTPETTRAFAINVARALADDKCTDLVVLDVRNLSSLSDYIVVGSGTSDRQMHFSIKNIVEMANSQGHQVVRTSSDDRKTWLIADFVDVIVHLFEPNTRAHYDIEMLWGDAPRLEWERADQISRDRAGLGAN